MTKIDYDKIYHEFHLQLLNAFIAQAALQSPFCFPDCSQDDQEFLNELKQLSGYEGAKLLVQGQQLLCRIVAGYSQLMPILPRDLLWFFGADCLHYMPDEEIDLFQRLDEQRQIAQAAQSPFSYEQARLTIFGLH